MASLTCDICGGQLAMDSSGEFAVCKNCGTEHDKRRMQAKIQEIQGTVKIDGPVQVEGIANVENLLLRAERFLTQDLNKAEEYCNKVLDLQPDNEKATILQNRIHIKKMISDFHLYLPRNMSEKLQTLDSDGKWFAFYLDEWLENGFSSNKEKNSILESAFYAFINSKDYLRADICFDRMEQLNLAIGNFSDITYLTSKKTRLEQMVTNKDDVLEGALNQNRYDCAEFILDIGANPNSRFGNYSEKLNYKAAIKRYIPKEDQKKYIELFQRYGAKKGLFD